MNVVGTFETCTPIPANVRSPDGPEVVGIVSNPRDWAFPDVGPMSDLSEPKRTFANASGLDGPRPDFR
jgi:hypothetical protein